MNKSAHQLQLVDAEINLLEAQVQAIKTLLEQQTKMYNLQRPQQERYHQEQSKPIQVQTALQKRPTKNASPRTATTRSIATQHIKQQPSLKRPTQVKTIESDDEDVWQRLTPWHHLSTRRTVKSSDTASTTKTSISTAATNRPIPSKEKRKSLDQPATIPPRPLSYNSESTHRIANKSHSVAPCMKPSNRAASLTLTDILQRLPTKQYHTTNTNTQKATIQTPVTPSKRPRPKTPIPLLEPIKANSHKKTDPIQQQDRPVSRKLDIIGNGRNKRSFASPLTTKKVSIPAKVQPQTKALH